MPFDLPQVVLPSLAYDVLICSLFTAVGWHIASIVSNLEKRHRARARDKSRS
jgi:hypothetical protein